MRCIRHDQRPRVGNESNRAIRWGGPRGIHQYDTRGIHQYETRGIHQWYTGHTAMIARKSLLLLLHVLSICLLPYLLFYQSTSAPLYMGNKLVWYLMKTRQKFFTVCSFTGNIKEMPKSIIKAIVEINRSLCGQIFKFTGISRHQSGGLGKRDPSHQSWMAADFTSQGFQSRSSPLPYPSQRHILELTIHGTFNPRNLNSDLRGLPYH